MNDQHISTLALLRGLVPNRRVTLGEALRIAELQANRLREHHQIEGPRLPSEIIEQLPRIAVEYDADMPVSGSAIWNGSRWVITLNAGESPQRNRFSLCHELKHIIDHTTRDLLYAASTDIETKRRAEKTADYFAACLLMPKRWVKRRWGEGVQKTSRLAEVFGVSTQAMSYRLHQLGLTEPYQRCNGSKAIYQRLTPGMRLAA